MDSFRKNRLGEDGTYRDFCRWYGGDCGDCFKRDTGNIPDCYEPHPENEQGSSSRPYTTCPKCHATVWPQHGGCLFCDGGALDESW